MNNSSSQHHAEAGRNFDLTIAGLSGLVSAGFTERIVDYVCTKPPEWGVVVSGLGFTAITFGGIAAHHWSRAFGATVTGNDRSYPPAER